VRGAAMTTTVEPMATRRLVQRGALDWLLAPAPARRLNLVRTLTVLYGLVWIGVRADHWRNLSRLPESRWRQVGIGGWLAGPPSTAAVTALVLATFGAGVVALGGRGWTVCGPLFAVGFLALTTFGASWGQILHTEHLPALHLLVLAAAPAGRGASATTGWPLRVMTLVTIGTYVVAGLAKFRFGGGLDWLDGDRLSRLVAHDNLRKRLLGDPFAPLARFVVGHPLLLRVGVWLTVLVELGAPLVVLGRRWRAAWIGSAWVFHITVLLTMAVLFPYPLFGIAFASMLPVERLRRQRSRASTRRP